MSRHPIISKTTTLARQLLLSAVLLLASAATWARDGGTVVIACDWDFAPYEFINTDGNRFVNEMETRDVVSAEILKQKDKCAFLVFDQNVRESLKAIDDYYRQGLLTQGNTLAELAEKIHVPISGLTKTIETYNKFVLSGVDSDFHRNAGSMDCVLNKAPFYAVKCIPAIHYTMGGLKINTKAQVMNKNHKAIPGLYAAGEVTGGVHGGARLGGNAVADYCVFGKIAADSALQYIGM